jgi:hypothetical protein
MGTHFDFVPDVVVAFEHRQVVLDRHDEAVPVHELVLDRAREVDARAKRDDGRLRRRVVLPEAERARREHLLRPLVVCDGGAGQRCNSRTNGTKKNRDEREQRRKKEARGGGRAPLIANWRFIASVRIFFRPSFSALSSM